MRRGVEGSELRTVVEAAATTLEVVSIDLVGAPVNGAGLVGPDAVLGIGPAPPTGTVEAAVFGRRSSRSRPDARSFHLSVGNLPEI